MTVIAILPARLGSTRLPRKMLADIGGEALIVRTWRRVIAASVAERVFVATDSGEIAHAAIQAGADVVRTGECSNGTSRVAEAARSLNLGPHDRILNVQGDEPLVSAQTLRTVVAGLLDFACDIATAAAELPSFEAIHPARVKVVSANGKALYFSRSPIPYGGPYQVHVGVYAYTNETLQRVTAYAEHLLETTERLEQLRWLAHGEVIQVVPVALPAPSVDTEEDLALVRQIVAREAGRG